MPSSINTCDANSYTSTSTPNSVASPAELSSSSSTDWYRYEGAVENVYTKGFQMVVSRHTPPAPFGLDYDTPPPEPHPDPTSLSQEALCFSCRPQEGQTFPGDTKVLTITSVIRTGAGRGPQVVVVNSSMVAKIFDPLFYDASERPDVVWHADKAYSCEAAVYEHLQGNIGVSAIVPAFYGTWTLDVESTIVRDGQRNVCIRPVRMILIEHLDGKCMIDLNTQELTTPARTVILKQCLHAYIRLYHAGIDHGDFCPRNVMIMGSDFVTPNVQIKLIDFGIAAIHDHPNYIFRAFMLHRKAEAEKWAPKLSSPLKCFFGRMDAFSSFGWCPRSRDEAEKWLWEQYRHDDRYIPVRFISPNGYKQPLYVNALGRIDDLEYEGDGDVAQEFGLEVGMVYVDDGSNACK